eukprot:TRINITY_DN18785_c0_g1_i4.p1 TRINITY_DN18785_c0_g1~~TRINITY_DN18785_c0_g1_i4.p1  ORF type:complete len:515 (-),score=58.25 TRINITY_DN18785_c0_g1_i4:135-1679(-)
MGKVCSTIRANPCGVVASAGSRSLADGSNEELLKPALEWGVIQSIVDEKPMNVGWDSSWYSVIGFYLFSPISLILGVLGGVCACLYRTYSWCVMSSVKWGNPLWMAWTWWGYGITLLTALVANARSRLGLFLWERNAWGGDNFWHGEGVWVTTHEMCDQIVRSEQMRKPAFGAISACVPDLFPPNILIFLPNVSNESEWKAIRQALHASFLDPNQKSYQDRLNALPKRIASHWGFAKVADYNSNTKKLRHLVSKCIFFMMFDIWVTDEEAEVLSGWRANAQLFILNRLLHRSMCNIGIQKIKNLRVNTVEIIERYRLQERFARMNDLLPAKYRRDPVVRLCDEIMYVVGFAGIGGTSSCCETAAAFMQLKTPPEFPADRINFGKYMQTIQMEAAYRKHPVAFLKECCRLDPPVTSATSVLKEDSHIYLGKSQQYFKEGTYRQYTLSLANRDPTVFANPDEFDPFRDHLNQALTWNGAFGTAGDELNYPRLCPGRHLAIDVVTEIFNHALGPTPT